MDYIIYLGGPTSELFWDNPIEWRVNITERFKDVSVAGKNYTVLSPLRGNTFLKDEIYIKNSYRWNMLDIKRADILIINLKKAITISIVSILEIGAAFILNKPVIIIMEPDNYHKHPILSEQAAVIVNDVDEAAYYTFQILG